MLEQQPSQPSQSSPPSFVITSSNSVVQLLDTCIIHDNRRPLLIGLKRWQKLRVAHATMNVTTLLEGQALSTDLIIVAKRTMLNGIVKCIWFIRTAIEANGPRTPTEQVFGNNFLWPLSYAIAQQISTQIRRYEIANEMFNQHGLIGEYSATNDIFDPNEWSTCDKPTRFDDFFDCVYAMSVGVMWTRRYYAHFVADLADARRPIQQRNESKVCTVRSNPTKLHISQHF